MRDIAGLLLVACTFVAGWSAACAQDIEPRAYSNAPVGANFLIAGYAYTQGGVAFDTALPVKNPQLKTSSAVFAYARVVNLWGKSGKLSAIVPYTWLSGSADYAGQTVQRQVDGLADSRFRLSVNLYGAPALRLKEFVDYKQDLIIGASLQVSAPTGQYDDSRLVNIGTNRWSFKPEVGVSKTLGPWTLEVAAAATSSVHGPKALETPTSGLNDHRLVPMLTNRLSSYWPVGADISRLAPMIRSCL